MAKAKDTLVSFEVLTPLKGKTIFYVYEHLDPLIEFKPAWVDVTYHSSETIIHMSCPEISLQQTIQHDRKKAKKGQGLSQK